MEESGGRHGNEGECVKKSMEVIVECADARVYTSKDAAEMSSIMKGMLEDCDGGGDGVQVTLPLKKAPGDIMCILLEYMEHYDTEAKRALLANNPYHSNALKGWDLQFLQPFNFKTLVDVYNVADYAGVLPLCDLVSAYIAHKLVEDSAFTSGDNSGTDCDGAASHTRSAFFEQNPELHRLYTAQLDGLEGMLKSSKPS